MYSGLCITIPPRNLKRKLQDVEEDGNDAISQQPKVSVPVNTTFPHLTPRIACSESTVARIPKAMNEQP